jgi:hypothetical protein
MILYFVNCCLRDNSMELRRIQFVLADTLLQHIFSIGIEFLPRIFSDGYVPKTTPNSDEYPKQKNGSFQ